METLKKTKSASIKMLNRYGYNLKDVDALIDLLNTQPQTFFILILSESILLLKLHLDMVKCYFLIKHTQYLKPHTP